MSNIEKDENYAESKPIPDFEVCQAQDVDIAASFLANLDLEIISKPISAKETSRLLWKIDLIILPIISATIILGAVDKVIISNAKIYGMMTDNHLSSSQYSWVGSILYLYVFLES